MMEDRIRIRLALLTSKTRSVHKGLVSYLGVADQEGTTRTKRSLCQLEPCVGKQKGVPRRCSPEWFPDVWRI